MQDSERIPSRDLRKCIQMYGPQCILKANFLKWVGWNTWGATIQFQTSGFSMTLLI